MDTALTFINLSNDASLSSVFFYQKNYAPDIHVTELAWKVINRCGREDRHPFVLPGDIGVGVKDSNGNYSPILSAQQGERLEIKEKPSGNQLIKTGSSTTPTEVQVVNGLEQGAISIAAYKDGRPVILKSSVAPRQMALFQFSMTLFAGVASQIALCQPINSLVTSCAPTELDLLGVASADIVLTGGGCGPASRPFRFRLQNVVMS